jgi:predicted O-linked N-acetylglucosamine transferase (SPINDLY family)
LFNLNYKLDFDPKIYLSAAKSFSKYCKPKNKLPLKLKFDHKPAKLKIGLVSSDFGNHPGGYFTLSTLRELKKKNFDLIAYSAYDRKDDFSPHFRPLFLKWHSIEKMKDDEVVEQIFKDGIHILFHIPSPADYVAVDPVGTSIRLASDHKSSKS